LNGFFLLLKICRAYRVRTLAFGHHACWPHTAQKKKPWVRIAGAVRQVCDFGRAESKMREIMVALVMIQQERRSP
jgi:hypothetical protein